MSYKVYVKLKYTTIAQTNGINAKCSIYLHFPGNVKKSTNS